MTFLHYLIFIALWLIPTLGATLTTSLVGWKTSVKIFTLMVVMQLTMFTITLTLCLFLGMNILGVAISPSAIIMAIFLLPVALGLGYVENRLEKKESFIADFIPDSKFHSILLFLILAPISEELLYRGLLEGYFLIHTELWFAIIAPAILFSIIHFAPFKNAPRKIRTTIILEAFVLGILAGYLRASQNSIIPAIIVHMEFNLYGVLKNP